MIVLEYEAELLKFAQRIEELLGRNQDLENRNQELEQEIKRLRELLNAKGVIDPSMLVLNLILSENLQCKGFKFFNLAKMRILAKSPIWQEFYVNQVSN